ncbi:phosphate/phosphite/phosphonate ABC transporter substrate-binding protein [Bremerella sp. T1]|uniref:phosphate/phosphite/phosphonate ABC transporter substrate-binding protein n=1 Tax=Bremerella sp. TYQ1 TaxID=3119568 RepID=UPI001CCFD617|nr:phosphate/phosphite/phosphonate ABC transporter substrate-binding protein [Bremerella volcania]UBM33789.1 phosphate/phosphite/phosphonate ABC transporter substrate-binding protein [Bremerella volcania]
MIGKPVRQFAMHFFPVLLGIVGFCTTTSVYAEEIQRDGSEQKPLQVMLIPADTGADTTLSDFRPVFNAIKENFGLHCELRVGTSYAAVVEGLAAKRVDIAFVGPVTFDQARRRSAAELLAVAVKRNSNSYRSAIVARRGENDRGLTDLRGKTIALGDINSTSSFRFPIAMLLNAAVDPVLGLKRVVITGSHSDALAALREGHVDAAGCSLDAYEKAINTGSINAKEFQVVAVSPPIPNPPLVMNCGLPGAVKEKLRDAFRKIHQSPGIRPEMIRGYGGDQYERYDIDFPQEDFDDAIAQLAPVTPQLIGAIIERAANR